MQIFFAINDKNLFRRLKFFFISLCLSCCSASKALFISIDSSTSALCFFSKSSSCCFSASFLALSSFSCSMMGSFSSASCLYLATERVKWRLLTRFLSLLLQLAFQIVHLFLQLLTIVELIIFESDFLVLFVLYADWLILKIFQLIDFFLLQLFLL